MDLPWFKIRWDVLILYGRRIPCFIICEHVVSTNKMSKQKIRIIYEKRMLHILNFSIMFSNKILV